MKFSAVLAAAAAVACAFSPAAAESEASVHLRIHESKAKTCYDLHCPRGQWCAMAEAKCRAPNYSVNECFNPATGAFQIGCSPGFKCKNGKCDYA